MSKYSDSQLMEMATEALEAKKNGNLDYHMLLHVLCMKFRMSQQQIDHEIHKLSLLEVD